MLVSPHQFTQDST